MASPRLHIGRRSEPGAWYVVTTVAYRRQRLFEESNAARVVMRELEHADGRSLRSLAWVVMPDHLHWLLELGVVPLSREVQALKSLTARAVNTELGRSGPVWQPGFFDHRIRDERSLRRQARYLLTNPVRWGLVDRIEDYPHLWCVWPTRSTDL